MALPNKRRPIGVFDSGLGGLTVVREIAKLLPTEDIVYLGDLAHLPYGNKSQRQITRYSQAALKFLKKFQIKLGVFACNSASATSYRKLASTFSIPMVSVIEPAVGEAVSRSSSGRIGVIGTEATIRSRAYERYIKREDPKARVTSQACPLFVSLVEEGWVNGAITTSIAHHYLAPLKKARVDSVILGCTHYPVLTKTLQKVMGPNVHLVHSGLSTARSVKRLLGKKYLPRGARQNRRTGRIRCFVTDSPNRFQVLGQKFLGRSIGQKVASVQEVRLDV
jgi:glutamate racemase